MILTGDERFTVQLYGQPPCTKRLADMSREEVLAVANADDDEPTRRALYRWQYEQRRAGPHPGPGRGPR